MKKILQKLSVMVMFSVFYPFYSNARIIRVPEDSTKIQSAINAAVNGDTILVSEGTYYENISFKGKNITVASHFLIDDSLDHITKTIINGSKPVDEKYGSVVRINSGETIDAVLTGFTITKGTGTITLNDGWVEGAGVLIENSAATISFNIITLNENVVRSGVTGGGGGGISSIRSNPKILNNIIMNNKSGYAGGIVFNWSSGIIRNNVIYNNSATGKWGTGGIMVWDASQYPGTLPQIVENNTIIGNTSISSAGGLSIDREANPAIVKNLIIWGNTQVTGGQVKSNAYGKISYSNIEDGFTGTGNIQNEPKFLANFELGYASPCIDAGDTANLYNDLMGINDTTGLFPSHGTLRNDMGAYGGPEAAELPVFGIKNDYLKGSPHLVTSIIKGNALKFDIEIYPNPAKEFIMFDFSLMETTIVECDLIDASGRRVKHVFNSIFPAGTNSERIETNDMSNGLYFLNVKINNILLAKEFIVSK